MALPARLAREHRKGLGALALRAVAPSPATHAILIQLKAGETADLIFRVQKHFEALYMVYKTLVDTLKSV